MYLTVIGIYAPQEGRQIEEWRKEKNFATEETLQTEN